MSGNRYHYILRENHRFLQKFIPAEWNLKNELVMGVERAIANGLEPRILDIGCGYGDLAKELLDLGDDVTVHGVDLSPEMLDFSRETLAEYGDRVTLQQADIVEENADFGGQYPIVVSAWTIHNIPVKDRENYAWHNVARAVEKNGIFWLLDKVYPNDVDESDRLLQKQLTRYIWNIRDLELRDAIERHERSDHDKEYRLTDWEIDYLTIGFDLKSPKNTHIFPDRFYIDRVERDALIKFDTSKPVI